MIDEILDPNIINPETPDEWDDFGDHIIF